jgi:GT2 family glycosyltransferase/glycosyltransferase involved in cell wall biosynthesis
MADLIAIGQHPFQSNMVIQSSSETSASSLEALLGSVSQALDNQDLSMALRLADRVRRITSRNSACTLLFARLLIKAGLAKQAVDYLKDEDDPEVLLVRGTALLEQGLLIEASGCCRDILKRFSFDAVDGLALFASRLCRAPGNERSLGWVGVNDSMSVIGEARSSSIEIQSVAGSHSSIRFRDTGDGWIFFACTLTDEVLGPVLARNNGFELLGSGFSWPPDFKPRAWVAVEEDVLIGEAQLAWSPRLRLDLELSFPGCPAKRTIATTQDEGSGPHTFSTPLIPSELAAQQLDVAVVLPDGKRMPLVGSPLYPGRRISGGFEEGSTKALEDPPGHDSSAPSESPGLIDIIVPVYAGQRETLECLTSVLTTIDRERAELVVVNDASPDLELCNALAAFAADKQVTLIKNPYNLGFPAAVNRGIKLHPDRDVILLNSDTQVFGDWIDRLTLAAHKSWNIGTVTPLGESGSITDYSSGDSVAQATAEEIDRIASEVNPGGVMDIPVGVGFCMYIKRKCLDQTGELDAVTFGKGYGEENDFCLRARSLGWRHVAATNVFIKHHGGRSFGEHGAIQRKRNSRVLDLLHPGYAALIEDFRAADPLLEARRGIDVRRLLAGAVDPVLLITHDLHGGVQRYVNLREAELRVAEKTAIVLQRLPSDTSDSKVSLSVPSLRLDNLIFDLPLDLGLLKQVLQDLCLSHIELHHFLRLPQEILQLVAQLAVPYEVYVHDYSWICPRVTLIDGSGRYCGEPELAGCEQCIQKHGSAIEEALTVSELRSRSAKLLQAAQRVIVPSSDSQARMARHFPDQAFELRPWESVTIPASQQALAIAARVRVAVIGAIGIPKGYQVLLDCARDAAARDLNLEFVVIGYTVDDHPLLETGRVFITGPYQEHEVGMLLEREGCDIAFFPSVAPETWCYSLTHAILRGMPILAYDLGAQAERLRDYPGAQLLPQSLNTQQVNFALVHSERTFGEQPERQVHATSGIKVDEQTMSEASSTNELASSTQVLRLPEGLYNFTVKEGGSLRDGPETLALPALQVGIAAEHSSGNVHFLTGSSTVERWLAYKTDMVVVKIAGGDAPLLLTSLQQQDSPSLAVHIERLNVRQGSLASQAKDSEVYTQSAADLIRMRLMAHIRYVGDMGFDTGCAGWPGQGMWIEGFAILEAGGLPLECIEYRGVLANGLQTPWLSNLALCGSRGEGMPLIGYAVRLKPAWAKHHECTYIGSFLSGAKTGPVEDGALCSSDLPGDPLDALEISLKVRELESVSTPNSGATPIYA